MNCKECGCINTEDQEYCKECGEKLSQAEDVIETAVETSEIDESMEAVDEAKSVDTEESDDKKVASKSKRTKIFAGIIALLLVGTAIGVYVNQSTLAANTASAKPADATKAAEKTPEIAAVPVSRETVLTIGKEVITEPVFKLYFWITQQQFESMGASVWEMELEGKKAEDMAKESTLRDIQISIAAKQKAEELKLTLSDEEKKAISDQSNDITTNNAELVTALQFELKDMEEFITHGFIVQKVIQNLSEGYTPTEEEISLQRDQVKAQYETATVKHVLIQTVDAEGKALPEDKVKEAKALAEDILKKALAGEDMAELAKTYSQDPGSKDQGGEYTFPKGQMVPEFETASFTGEIGKVYPELVETAYGYHIVKVEARNQGDAAQIEAESKMAAQYQYAQAELMKMGEALEAQKTDLFNSIGVIKK
ncbi:MAG: hypothetical protein K0R69_2244 [Clostridia bacterium]|nr:hypothetical protein [Clostridia bacterium]